jgi:hypothetical protein
MKKEITDHNKSRTQNDVLTCKLCETEISSLNNNGLCQECFDVSKCCFCGQEIDPKKVDYHKQGFWFNFKCANCGEYFYVQQSKFSISQRGGELWIADYNKSFEITKKEFLTNFAFYENEFKQYSFAISYAFDLIQSEMRTKEVDSMTSIFMQKHNEMQHISEFDGYILVYDTNSKFIRVGYNGTPISITEWISYEKRYFEILFKEHYQKMQYFTKEIKHYINLKTL